MSIGGIPMIVLGLALAAGALWQEEPAAGALDHLRQLGLPVGLAVAQVGALLVAVPGFFGP